MTAQTEVRDYVIWSKHIHGDQALAQRIETLAPGQTVDLEVDGVSGAWRKMDQGKDGRPTPGIRPLGAAQQFWRELYRSRRGALVSVRLIRSGDSSTVPVQLSGEAARDREAALEALLAMRGQGWRSDGSRLDRDEAHAR